VHELFITFDHEDPGMKSKAARMLAALMCKHEYDLRYQSLDDKLYIAQLYFPLIGMVSITLVSKQFTHGNFSSNHLSYDGYIPDMKCLSANICSGSNLTFHLPFF
jgi:hypothetical protein